MPSLFGWLTPSNQTFENPADSPVRACHSTDSTNASFACIVDRLQCLWNGGTGGEHGTAFISRHATIGRRSPNLKIVIADRTDAQKCIVWRLVVDVLTRAV